MNYANDYLKHNLNYLSNNSI